MTRPDAAERRRLWYGALGIASLVILLAGCAAPGAPIARQPAVLQGISDLAAQQLGDTIFLTFALPQETTTGHQIANLPQVEIYREIRHPEQIAAGATPPPEHLLETISPQMLAQYRMDNRIRYPDVLNSADLSSHGGEDAVYMIRTRISRRDSADSNLVAIPIFPAPKRVPDLQARVTKSSIELSWSPSQVPASGPLPPPVIRYRVYRAKISPATEKSGQNESPPAFVILGETKSSNYGDANFVFGQSYEYEVATVAQYEAGTVESEASKAVDVTPRDTFPPAAPEGLVAAVVPAMENSPAYIDLSWAISTETNLAGYNVYRSEAETSRGMRLNNQLLLTSAFRDNSAEPGKRYFYRVTAMDRFGNESSPSSATAAELPSKNDPVKP